MTNLIEVLFDNADRRNAGYAQHQRVRALQYSALTAGGGRVLRTQDDTSEVIATVGEHASSIARSLQLIDRSPATFLHDLAVVADGRQLDVPRLVRAALDPTVTVDPSWNCPAVQTLRSLGEQLHDAKPGAAQAIKDIVTSSLDRFGPVLLPAQLAWHLDNHEDHHTYRCDIDLSMAFASSYEGDLIDIVEEIVEMGSGSLHGAMIASLCDWDAAFAADMDDADWQTVEIVSDPQTVRLLAGVVGTAVEP